MINLELHFQVFLEKIFIKISKKKKKKKKNGKICFV